MNKKIAFIFPGQGSQSVGMLSEEGTQYPVIRETFQEASDTLGYDLWQLTQEGPLEALGQTEYAQPALLTAGVALWRAWHVLGNPSPVMMAGHSLGEYSALVCAGVFSLSQGLSLVVNRGRWMQEAVPQGAGAMAAILGADAECVRAWCEQCAEDEVVFPANYNCPGQVVISGHQAAVHRVIAEAKEAKMKAILLSVSVPSHCSLMQSASEKLKVFLSDMTFYKPTGCVLHNLDAVSREEPEAVKEALVAQLTHPVRWAESVQKMLSYGINAFFECGPGKVLSNLNKRIAPTLGESLCLSAVR